MAFALYPVISWGIVGGFGRDATVGGKYNCRIASGGYFRHEYVVIAVLEIQRVAESHVVEKHAATYPYVVAVAAPWLAVDGIGEPFHVADEYVVAHSAAEPVALCVRCAWACISQHQVYLPVVEGGSHGRQPAWAG